MTDNSMQDRKNEIPRMIEILQKNPDWKSLTFFQYKGNNVDLKKPLTQIRITKYGQQDADTQIFIVTIGRLNYKEREYVKRFKKEQAEACGDKGCWPDDFFQRYPKRKIR